MANVPQNFICKQNLSGNQEAPLILGCNERQVQRYNVIIDKAIIHEQLLCNVEINMCTAGPNFCHQETPATRGPNLIELPDQSAKLVLRSPWWQTLRCLDSLNLSDLWKLRIFCCKSTSPDTGIPWNHGPSPSNLGFVLCVARPTHIHDLQQKSPRIHCCKIWDLVSMSDFKIKVCESMHW